MVGLMICWFSDWVNAQSDLLVINQIQAVALSNGFVRKEGTIVILQGVPNCPEMQVDYHEMRRRVRNLPGPRTTAGSSGGQQHTCAGVCGRHLGALCLQ